ncbi:hypothetical protein FDECE_5547 [Fusarium decemcellulare]|nr:hypothetical protein FDECE_5547 [Fusarium decemcellulare]
MLLARTSKRIYKVCWPSWIHSTLASRCQVRSNFTTARPVAYKCICVMNENDIESLYPLITSYVRKPSLADALREVVFDADQWPTYTCYEEVPDPDFPQEWAEEIAKERAKKLRWPPGQVDNDAHSALEDYVHSLAFEQETSTQIINALSWKKHQWQGQQQENLDSLSQNNRAFACAALVVIFSLCRNISTLRLGKLLDSPLLEDYFLKSNYGRMSHPGLQQLKHVEVVPTLLDERHYEDVEFLDYFRYFGRLPAIDTISMDGVMEHEAERGFAPPGTSNIKRIHLSHVDIPSRLLSTIIRIPEGLEEFKVSIGGLWHIDGMQPFIFPKTLGKSLLQHKKTLKVLELDIDIAALGRKLEGVDSEGYMKEGDLEKDEYFRLDEAASKVPFWLRDVPDDRSYGYTVGSLADFESLTHLSIGVRALLGPNGDQPRPRLETPPPFRLIDALPPSLEYLCLYGYVKGENEDLDGHVEELMRYKAERLPRLVEIRGVDEEVLGVANTYDGDDPEDKLWDRPKREWKWIEA